MSMLARDGWLAYRYRAISPVIPAPMTPTYLRPPEQSD